MDSTKTKGAPWNGTPSKAARRNCKRLPKGVKDIFRAGALGDAFYRALFVRGKNHERE